MLTPATAKKLADVGYDKASVKDYLRANTKIHVSQMTSSITSWGDKGLAIDGGEYVPDENGFVRLPFIDEFYIAVVGGIGEKNELIPLWSSPSSREITLPENWDASLYPGRFRSQLSAANCF